MEYENLRYLNRIDLDTHLALDTFITYSPYFFSNEDMQIVTMYLTSDLSEPQIADRFKCSVPRVVNCLKGFTDSFELHGFLGYFLSPSSYKMLKKYNMNLNLRDYSGTTFSTSSERISTGFTDRVLCEININLYLMGLPLVRYVLGKQELKTRETCDVKFHTLIPSDNYLLCEKLCMYRLTISEYRDFCSKLAYFIDNSRYIHKDKTIDLLSDYYLKGVPASKFVKTKLKTQEDLCKLLSYGLSLYNHFSTSGWILDTKTRGALSTCGLSMQDLSGMVFSSENSRQKFYHVGGLNDRVLCVVNRNLLRLNMPLVQYVLLDDEIKQRQKETYHIGLPLDKYQKESIVEFSMRDSKNSTPS